MLKDIKIEKLKKELRKAEIFNFIYITCLIINILLDKDFWCLIKLFTFWNN